MPDGQEHIPTDRYVIMAGTVRLFISAEAAVTDDVREAMSELGRMRNIRPSPENQIHITLSFLGDTDESRIPRLVGTLRDALKGIGGFGVSMKGLGAFPNTKRPRVIWIGLDDGRDALALLAERVRGAVDSAGLHQDGKPFSPHVTIARVQGPADVSDIAERYRGEVFAEYRIESVRLMGSVLGPSGAKHRVIETFVLDNDGA